MRAVLPQSFWLLLPQATSRLSAVYVFALAANRVSASELGVLAIATAVTAASFGLGPAVVGKPLAVLSDTDEQGERGPMAQSFAVGASLAVGVLLAVAAIVSGGAVRLTCGACALGVPAAMTVESQYWRTVFALGRRQAGSALAGAFLCQSLVVTVAALFLSPTSVVLSPFVGLALAATVVLARRRDLSWSGARRWVGGLRPTWMPYVAGVAAAVVLVQTIPVVLATAAGLAAASTYRAGELVFGGTNLLIGVLTQMYLTQDAPDVRRAYSRVTVAIVTTAVANGLAVSVLPTTLLEKVVGPVAPSLRDLLPFFTVQRSAMGLAYVGSILLLRTMSPARAGGLGVASASANLALLIGGAAVGGVTGGVVGLAIAEAGVAVVLVRLVRRVP